MKNLILLSFSILLTFGLSAQIDIDKSKINSAYLKFLPSNANPEDLRPSDIPSKQVLKQMGLSDEEIAEAMDYKFSKGKYAKGFHDTIRGNTNLSKFYESFGDTLAIDTTSYPKARIYGQDIFRNNKLSFYQKALDAKAPENYKVGSGDEISISVWGYSEFSENLLVDQRGYITPSSYGRIYVKGLTFKKMRSLLKSKFGSFLDMKNSEIDVTLSYSRVITVHIVGEVYNPGSYTIPAINTAFNALIAANGPNQLGSVRNIYIKRDGKSVDSLDVYQFLFNPTRSQDIYMQDGDYLFVPPAKHIIEVKGAVNRPYTYEAKTGESVASLIQYAGGYTTNAYADVLTLKRIEYNAIKVNDVHKDHINSTIVQNGDEVVVNTISNKLSNVVSVKGSIGVSGDYEFIRGEYILDLLKRAKCIDDKTFLDKVYVIRLNDDRTKSHIAVDLEAILNDEKHKDNILLKEYDIIRVLSIDDFDDNFSVSVLGAVRAAGEFDFGVGMTLQDVLLQAGGLTQQAEGSRVEVSRIMDYDISSNKLKPRITVIKTIKIGDYLVLSAEAEEFILQPFDQIFVRENPNFKPAKNIVLSGEVKYPGTYTLLSKDEKISSVIKRAGGLTRYAYLEGVTMFRKEVVSRIQNTNITLKDLSQELLDSIYSNPNLSLLYQEEIQKMKVENFESFKAIIMYNKVYLNLDKALQSNESKHNLVLLEGDSVIVPKTMDFVHISGELMNLEGGAISAPYFRSRRANYYVNNFAGGFTKINKKANTVVIYPNGIAKKSMNFGLFVISPRVKKGSIIKVINKVEKLEDEKIPIDWNNAIEKTMLKVTAILSLWLLVDRVVPAQ
ncbi:SLBB domain-containing protein [Flavobacteriales bacterium]|nr:SLBB domain-containing protein [Flavobacteriales bacterium]